MPRFATNAGARILQWFVLQTIFRQTDGTAIGEKKRAVSRYEVREPPATPQVTMEPQATIHGVDHSIPEFFEFFKWRRDVDHVAARLIAGDDSGDGCRRDWRRRSHEQRTEVRIRQRVRRGGSPARGVRLDDRDSVAPRRVELQGIYERAIRGVIVEVPLLSSHEVVQITTHPGVVRLSLCRLKLRYRDRGQDADDHDDYE